MRAHSFRWILFSLLVASPLATAALKAGSAETHFTDSLSTAEQRATGLTKLSAEERAALDLQIAREIALARQGDVIAFAKTFNERRTPDQTRAAGLATLTNDERAQLDAMIAQAVARRPAPTFTRFSKKDDDAAETVTYRPQLHGEVSLTYGTAGKGRYFYGGSLTTILDDPAHHLTVSFTYAEYHGKGLSPWRWDPLVCER